MTRLKMTLRQLRLVAILGIVTLVMGLTPLNGIQNASAAPASVVFTQYSGLTVPNLSQSREGLGSVSCPGDPYVFGGQGPLFGLNTPGNSWGIIAHPGAAAGDGGPILNVSFFGNYYMIIASWTNTAPDSIICEGHGTIVPATAIIFGQCGTNVVANLFATNGVRGNFEGDAVCTMPTAVVTVKAFDPVGAPLHMNTLLKNSAMTTLSSGFTPTGFTVNTGTQYYVKVNNFGTHVFQHWQDQPLNTNPVRPINISSDATIVAVYS